MHNSVSSVKTEQLENPVTKKAYVLAMFVGLVFIFGTGCSSSSVRKLQGTDLAPAAQGIVKLDKTDNNNTSVDLKVKHLAPPKRIASDANLYVVWLQPTMGDTQRLQNMGALKVDKDLNGEFKTVVPHRHFKLFITAENSAMVSNPSGERILETPLTAAAE